MKQLLGWFIAVPLAAITFALLIGALMATAPGFFPVLILAVVWAAKELPVVDLDSELAALLAEGTR